MRITRTTGKGEIEIGCVTGMESDCRKEKSPDSREAIQDLRNNIQAHYTAWKGKRQWKKK